MDLDVGQRIALWRDARGMTRQDLADAVGVTVAAVYQWEGTGEHKTSPTVATLEKVVKAFKISMAEFYGAIPKAKAKAS